MKPEKKAQAAIMGLIFAFMLVAIYAVMQAPLLDFIELGINETQNSTLQHATLIVTVMQAIPLFMALIILVAVVAYVVAHWMVAFLKNQRHQQRFFQSETFSVRSLLYTSHPQQLLIRRFRNHLQQITKSNIDPHNGDHDQ